MIGSSTTDAGLERFAADASDFVTLVTDRDDVVVRAGKGLGRGAPACFIPATGEIEIDTEACAKHDAKRLAKAGWTLGSVDLVRPKHRGVVPVTTGALLHEAGHSLYTRWTFPEGTPNNVRKIALALEEGRMERRMVHRDPQHKRYIKRVYSAIVAPGLAASLPDDADPLTLLHAAALILSRNIGLPLALLEALRAVVGDINKLELTTEFWRPGADHDNTVLETAKRWIEALPKDKRGDDGSGTEGAGSSSEAGEASGSEGEGATSCPTASMGDGCGNEPAGDIGRAIADMGAAEEYSSAPADDKAVAEATDPDKPVGGHAGTAAGSGKHGFTLGPEMDHALIGWREPTPTERHTARRLTALLQRVQSRAPETRPSVVPPGRLRGRAAVSWARDRSLGKASDAMLWRAKTRKGDGVPPVRLGIAMDVSGSMNPYEEVTASIGWALAAASEDVESVVGGVCFGRGLTQFIKPGRATRRVPVLSAHAGSEAAHDALQALDDQIGLMEGDGVRILVIISDGIWVDHAQQKPARAWLERYIKSGGLLLYVALDKGTVFSGPTSSYTLPTAPAVAGDLSSVVKGVDAMIRKGYKGI